MHLNYNQNVDPTPHTSAGGLQTMNAIDNVGEAFHNASREAAKTGHFRRGTATAHPATQWEAAKISEPNDCDCQPADNGATSTAWPPATTPDVSRSCI